MATPEKNKSLESWIWDAACSIRGAKDAPKYKDYILPPIFTKRLCDVFDDELNRIAKEVGSRKKAFQLAKADHKLVRFYLPLVPDDPEQPVWSVIRKLSDKIGEGVTTQIRAIARGKPAPPRHHRPRAHAQPEHIQRDRGVGAVAERPTANRRCTGFGRKQKSLSRSVKKAQLQGRFRTLLHQLMTTKTRVHKLEITV